VSICGDKICGYGETQENCCKDCGCYNQVCNLELNRCENINTKLANEEAISILYEYMTHKGWDGNVSDVQDTVFDNLPGKSATISLTDGEYFGAIVLDNRTVFILKQFKLIDVWQKT
jgi:hypothetical protein